MSVDMDEILRAREEADCLADATAVDAALARMAAEITAQMAGSNPMVYTVMNGGLILAGRILPRLPFPLEVGYLHATRYGHALKGTQLDWRVRPTSDLRGRTVLVLDDILDEGHTLHAILDYLRAEGAKEVRAAVLAHKVHDRKAYPGMRADFTGIDVADRFLFGCGMDYKGYWRNAPGIYAVKGL
ncbi:hypoxanthine-guanine phosphoribosyltransferase [Aromatoleum aromaticum]|uniref:Hypoxanthine phosphoribosyltransferase n=1 Tax=Aromatoleum aromaticum (strain DSM 19018 / LMG 30748 / EbN1) TaxID=76114 RepID=Q5P3X7_AROAE|nr:hypoxanthine-guanine phosphoribosyltransferase [Aromatoleum aromaticum]NMG55548.1 hypoxanthine-guanine phosphoribosyltransferase [Aromatoleum aromaticum]CAI07986.1 putative hypoxanthine phosphoribosyltransferase [Aromatoleum aromaticum EbN1]